MMKSYKGLLLISIYCFCFIFAGTDGTIRGRVTDEESIERAQSWGKAGAMGTKLGRNPGAKSRGEIPDNADKMCARNFRGGDQITNSQDAR